MNNLILQLYIEYRLSGAIPYISYHPEIGLGIFNVKDEPSYSHRVKNIKKLGIRGNKISYLLSKLIDIKNPLPSFVDEGDINDTDDPEKLKELAKELLELNERLNSTQQRYNDNLKNTPKEWNKIKDSLKKTTGAANVYYNMITNTGQIMSDIVLDTGRQYEMSEKIAKSYKKASLNMGLNTKQGALLANNFKKASVFAARYGIDVDYLEQSISSIAEQSGRITFLSEKEYERITLMQSAMKMSASDAGEISDRFQLMGVNISNGYEKLEESFQESRKLGLNAQKVMDVMQRNFASMQRMSFKGGVKAMTEMSRLAVEMRMDVSGMLSMADKFYNPEQAIEAAAELQLMGGDIAKAFGDPFEVMYMARNKPEELAKKLQKMTENMTVFNEETGEYELPAEARQQLIFMADKLGQSKDEIIDLAYQSSKLKDVKEAFGDSTMFNEDEKSAIAQMAQFKDGEWKVTVGDEELSLDDSRLKDAVKDGSLLAKEGEEEPLEQMVDNSFTTNELLTNILDSFEKGVSISTDFYEIGERLLKDSISELGAGIPDILTAVNEEISKAMAGDDTNPAYLIFNEEFQEDMGKKLASTVEFSLDFIESAVRGEIDTGGLSNLDDILLDFVRKYNNQILSQGNEQPLPPPSPNPDDGPGDFIYTKNGELIRYDEMDDVMGMKSGGAIDKLLDLARGNNSSNGNITTTLEGAATINVNIKSDNPSLDLSGMEDRISKTVSNMFLNAKGSIDGNNTSKSNRTMVGGGSL
jgi:hypothetical protein